MASYLNTPSGDVVLVLSGAEARGLVALAGEGGAGLLVDAAAARAYIGGHASVEAARRALDALKSATADQPRKDPA